MKFIDSACFITAGLVGMGLHLQYAFFNNEYLKGIFENFTSGRFLQDGYVEGASKILIPFILPYGVSYFSRRSVRKKSEAEIKRLKEEIRNLQQASKRL